jgi:dihydroxyacetone kinase
VARPDESLEPTVAVELRDEQARANHVIVAALEAARDVIDREHVTLGELDAIAGDGDHGTGMLRGVNAALAFASEHAADTSPGALLRGAGDAWSETAGGTSGALWGAMLAALGKHADGSAWDASKAADAAADAAAAVTALGKAQVGDKTMVDAIEPYVATIRDRAGLSLADALAAAANAAITAAERTSGLSPKLGRARPLAERSIGHPDPGATSFALIVAAIAEAQGAAS